MKSVVLMCLLAIPSSLSAWDGEVPNLFFSLDSPGVKALWPIEIYDAATFVNWPGYPPLDTFLYLDTEPSPQNSAEILAEIGYPAIVREAFISGAVLFRLLINEEGTCIRMVALQGHPLVIEEVGRQVQNLIWTPAQVDGEPVLSWVNFGIKCMLPARE
ncbi:MAG: energy transducer TonB [Bacteroidia bacterium]|nr:energy transducer TonB [Bacteroidia bacterium]